MRVPENRRRGGASGLGACLVMVVMSLLSPGAGAGAGEWRVAPRLNVIETYTDNLRFQPSSSSLKTDDFVTQINPGVTVRGLARRYNAQVDYMMNNLIYARNSNFTRMRHQLNANGTAELFEDLFYVDGRAFITQQNISPLGSQALDNVNITGNRANVSSYVISPYLRHRFQSFATTEVRYTRNWVNSSAGGLFNSIGDGVNFSLKSGSEFKTLNWGVNYSNQMIHFSTGRSVELERSTGNLRYMITPQFGITATGGYEKNTFISIRGSPSAPIWTVGLAWEPSNRTNIAVDGGQRFFGNTYTASATHRTRMTVWDLSYNQNITTFNQQSSFGIGSPTGLGGFVGPLGQLLAAQNPNLSPDVIQQTTGALLGGVAGTFLNPTNFLSNRLFLQKIFQASVAVNGTRNTVILRVFDMTRRAFSPESVDAGLSALGNPALLNHTKQSGVSAFWTYRLSELTSANLNFGYTRFNFLGAHRVDDFMMVRVGLTRRFPISQPNTTGTIEVRHQQRDSNQPGSNYQENAVIAYLNMGF